MTTYYEVRDPRPGYDRVVGVVHNDTKRKNWQLDRWSIKRDASGNWAKYQFGGTEKAGRTLNAAKGRLRSYFRGWYTDEYPLNFKRASVETLTALGYIKGSIA